MDESTNQQGSAGNVTGIFLSSVIGVAAVGYFVGINDGVPRHDDSPTATALTDEHSHLATTVPTSSAIPALTYSEMRRSETGPTSNWNPTLEQIPQPKYNLFAAIQPSDTDKERSTLTRASHRAFNGAPPIIPHAVENTADAACYACHSQGLRIDNRVANGMSHQFLANCTQCHAPPPPKPFTNIDAGVDNTFIGLPAPLKGQRAFAGAPPTIPHSTWMRQKCLSCHGGNAGWAGLESTHPWRINCIQCHAPSAQLDQAVVPAEVGFLAAPNVSQ